MTSKADGPEGDGGGGSTTSCEDEEGASSQGRQLPLEAGKSKELMLPQTLQKEHSPVDTLIPGLLSSRTFR